MLNLNYKLKFLLSFSLCAHILGRVTLRHFAGWSWWCESVSVIGSKGAVGEEATREHSLTVSSQNF